jgi:uncharacterized protein
VERLLDINVLIALCDPNHIDHERVTAWFEEVAAKAWVSCPITENGFIRILSSAGYPGLSGGLQVATRLLEGLHRHQGHKFWADDYSIIDGTVRVGRAGGSKQVTDLYLLGLAARRQGKFTSLDARIAAHLVQGGTQAYEVVPAL